MISMEQVEDEKKFKEPFGGKKQARTPKMLSLNPQEGKKKKNTEGRGEQKKERMLGRANWFGGSAS